MLLNRSNDKLNCSVALQAQKAADSGYSMLVIINNKEEDLEYLDIEDEYNLTNLSIPIIIIRPNDGVILKSFV